MPAKNRYLTSLFSSFSTFLENSLLTPLQKSLALDLVKDFTTGKINLEEWSSQTQAELLKFCQQKQINSSVTQVIGEYFTQYPPYQTNVFLYEYLLALKSNGCSPSTIKNYRSDISQFFNLIGEKQISKAIVKPKIEIFLKYQQESELQKSSVSRKLKSLNQFFLWLLAENIITVNPISSTDPDSYQINQVESEVSSYLKKFTAHLQSLKLTSSTIRNYHSDIEQYIEFAKTQEISQLISRGLVLAFVQSQKQKNLKTNSIIRKLKSLNQFAGWLLREKVITQNPLSNYEKIISDLGLDKTEAKNQSLISSNLFSRLFQKPAKPIVPLTVTNPFPAHTPEVKFSQQEIATAGVIKNQEKYFSLKSQINNLTSRMNFQTNHLALTYLNLLLLIVFIFGLGFFGYQQFFANVEQKLAYPTSLTRPNRVLSFQGRLTDTAQNPINAATDFVFKLYDSGPSIVGGTALWNSSTCSLTPDQDGIFSTGLGDECGSEITEDVFTENANVWLQVEVEGETLSPRQKIKTVPYALNAETLQGYPASQSAVENTVLIMDNNGDVNLGSYSPTLKSTSGTFTIEGQSITIQTTSGSNGDIVLAPDGLGEIIARSYLSAPGATLSATYDAGVPLTLKGGPSGTANLTEWRTNADALVALVGADGSALFSNYVNTSEYRLNNYAALSNSTTNLQIGNNAYWQQLDFYTGGSSKMTVLSGGNVGIGTTNPTFKIDVNGTIRSITGSITSGNGTGAGDLFLNGNNDAQIYFQSGGTTIGQLYFNGAGTYFDYDDTLFFRGGYGGAATLSLTNTGLLSLTGNLDVSGTTEFNNIAYTWPGSQSSNYILQTNGSGTLSWVDPNAAAASTIYWYQTDGTVYPKNSTVDMLIGGTSSASAKFAVLNVLTGTPTASVSAGAAGATYITANGTLATTAMQPLTIGNGTTGNIQFYSAANKIDSSGNLTVAGNINSTGGDLQTNSVSRITNAGNLTNIGTTQFNNITYTWPAAQTSNYFLQTNGSGTLSWAQAALPSEIFWTMTGNAIHPKNAMFHDLAIGGTSTASARFFVAAATGDLTLRDSSGNETITVTANKFTSNVPTEFTSPGDVGMAYDLLFTNQTASYIKSYAPLTIEAGESFESNPLTLKTYNSGQLVFDLGGGFSSSQAQTWDLVSSTSALNFESGLLNLDTTNTRIGINTTTPTATLDINGTASTSGTLAFRGTTDPKIDILNGENFGIRTSVGGDTGLTERMTITNAGNIGIGTTSPGVKLDVSGSAIRLTSASTAYNDVFSAGAADAMIRFGINGNPAWSAGNDSANSDFVIAQTSNLDSAQKFVIKSTSGNVGIGTTNPGQKLVVGDITDQNTMRINGLSTSNMAPVISLFRSGLAEWVTAVSGPLINNGFVIAANPANYTDSGLASAAKLVISSEGNVGIGTTTPDNTLDVVGTLDVSGTTEFNDIAYTWPAAQTANYVLQTNGSGTLSWVDPAAAVASNIYWTLTGEQVHPKNALWHDLAIGGTSTSSATIFGAANTGYLSAQRFSDTANSDYYLDPAATGTSMAVAGSVGIGTTSPTQRLDVRTADSVSSGEHLATYQGNVGGTGGILTGWYANGSSNTGGYLRSINGLSLFLGTTTNKQALTILDDGTVGIGTVSPGAKFEVTDATTPEIRITPGASTTADPTLYLKDTGTTNGFKLWYDNDTGLTYFDNKYDNDAGDMRFRTKVDGTPVDVMTLDAAGNVGIGTTNPSSPLTITRNGNDLRQLAILGNPSAGRHYQELQFSLNGDALALGSGIRGYFENYGTNYKTNLAFFTSSGASTTYEAMLIDSAGNVGIGSTSPDNTLDLVGTLDVSGTTEFNNLVYTWPAAQTANYVLQTNGSGTLSWVDPAAAVASNIYWTQADGAIYPKNSTVDMLVGGTTTASAKFAVLNMLTGTPTASIAGSVAGYGLSLTGDGTIATTLNRNLLLNPSGGNVGIGTTSPEGRLHIFQNTTGQKNFVLDDYLGNERITFYSDSTNGAVFNGSDVHISQGGGVGRLVLQASSVDYGYVYSAADSFTGADQPHLVFTNGNHAYLQGDGSGTTYIGYNDGGRSIIGDGSGADILVVDNSNVGIGTTSPGGKLQVGSGTATSLLFDNSISAVPTEYPGMFTTTGTGTFPFDGYGGLIIKSRTNSGSGLPIVFYTGGTGTGTERMTIAAGGSVGIGTTTPDNTLDLVGTLDVSGTTEFNDIAYTWPAAQTANYVLQTNGSGTLSWVDPAAAVASNIYWTLTGEQVHPKNALWHDLAIGGTSTSSATIFGAANTGYLNAQRFADTANSDYYLDPAATGTSMAVAGSVGIGTTSPASKLHIYGGPLTIERSGADFITDGDYSAIYTTQTGATYPFGEYGNLVLQSRATADRDIAFVTGDAPAVRMVVGRTGNVGIGTTTPTALLDIAGTASSSGTLAFRGTTDPKIDVLNGENLGFRTSVGGDTGLSERMTITNAGNVGIGTTSPDKQLQIYGAQTGAVTYNGWGATITRTNSTSDTNLGTYFEDNQYTLAGTNYVGNVIGSHNKITISNTGSTNHVRSVMGRIAMSGSGTAQSATSFAGFFEGGSSGTVANYYGLAVGNVGNVSAFTNASGTVTNTYGIYLGDLTAGTQTNTPYGIYQEDTGVRNYFGSSVGIGSTSPDNTLDVVGTLDVSGTTEFNDIAYTWPASQTANYVLSTNGSGTLSWADPASAVASSIYWTQANGTVYPKNPTVDMLVGGTTTASAKFAVLNMLAGTPTASISAGTAGASFLTADGYLSTTARQNLTIGNSSSYNTTGNVLINPNGTGNVGIGITNPAAKLHVNNSINIGSSSSYTFLSQSGSDFYLNAGNGDLFVNGLSNISLQTYSGGSYQSRIYVSNVGNVGIGSTTPTAKLDITGSASSSGTLAFRGTTDPKIDVLNGENLGFRTSVGGDTGLTERMTITNSGNVGIGTTDPATTLHLVNATTDNSVAQLRISSAFGNGIGSTERIGEIEFYSNDTDQQGVSAFIRARSPSGLAHSAGSLPTELLFGVTPNGSTTNTTAMVINNAGYVGISTTSPDSLLSVGSTSQFQVNSSGIISSIDGVAHSIDDVTGDLTLNSNSSTISLNDNVTFAGTTTLNSIAYTWPAAQTANYVLQTNGSGTLSWVDPAAAVASNIYWTLTGEQIHPKNALVHDLMIGGTSTASAKFFAQANTGNGYFAGSVGIGTTSPGSKLQINADASGIGQIIRANATTPGNLTEWQNSSGGILSSVLSNGSLNITGNVILTDTQEAINLNPKVTASIANNVSALNGEMTIAHTSGVVGNAWGMNFTMNTLGSTANIGNLVAFRPALQHRGSGVISNAYLIAADTFTNTGGGSITNAYGISLPSINVGTSTNYSIYTNLGDASFGDDVLLRNDSDHLKLGAGGDLDLYHDGTNSYITNNTGDLYIGDASTDDVILSANGGNVGIGTTSPGARLTVAGGSAYFYSNEAGQTDRRLTLNTTDADLVKLYLYDEGATTFHDVLLGGDGSATKGITILGAGNVGISTTTIDNTLEVNGTIDVSGTTEFGDIAYTWPGSQTANYVLQTNGSGTLSWTDPAAAVASNIYWTQADGAIYPKNPTVDMLVGGTSTTSAKFAVLNVLTGTPTASISANSGNIATYITGDGTLATTNRNNLTIGNSATYDTTGNVLINPNGTGNVGIGTTNPSAKLQISTGSLFLQKSYAASYPAYAITPANNEIWGNDSAAADAGFLRLSAGGGTTIGEKAGIDILGYSTTNSDRSQIRLYTAATQRMTIDRSGNVGINTTSPTAKLDIAGSASLSGTLAFRGTTDPKIDVLNGENLSFRTSLDGDAGLTERMTILNTGYVGIGTTSPATLVDILKAQDAATTLTIGNTNTGTAARTGIEINNSNGGLNLITGGSGYTGVSTWQNKGVIGTDSALGGMVFYTGGAGDDISFEMGGTGTADITFKDTGYVGIGTTSPGALLELSKVAGSDPSFLMTDGDIVHGMTGLLPTNGTFKITNGGPTSGGAWVIGASYGTTATGLILNGVIGVDDPADTNPAVLFTAGKKSGTSAVALGAAETAFQFENGAATGGTKLLTILGNGSVGIGTTSPTGKLDVLKAAGVDAQLTNTTVNNIQFTGDGSVAVSGSYTYKGLYINNAFVSSDNTGASTNIGLDVNVSGGDTNYAALFNGGNVGIGTTNPTSLLSVGSTSQFQVNSSGIIAAIDGVAHSIDDVTGDLTLNSNSSTISLNDNVTFAGTTTLNSIAYTWPAAQTGSNLVLQNNGSGTLSWTDVTSLVSAGTNYWTINSGAIYPNNSTLDLLVGGTATTSAKFAVNAVTGDASASGNLTVGNGGQIRSAYGPLNLAYKSGAIAWTTGMVINEQGNVGIGTDSPGQKLSIEKNQNAATQLRVRNDTSGTAASSQITASYGDWTQYSTLAQINPSYTTNGMLMANSTALISYGNTNGMKIFTLDGYDITFGTNNTANMTLKNGGNFGIGTTNPTSLFSVGSSSQFQVNSSGIIAAIDGVAHSIDDVAGNLTLNSNSSTISLNDNVTFAGTTTLNSIAYTWPAAQTANYVLQTNGSGTLSWADPASAVASSIYWTQASGAVYPKNSTVDMLVGGTTTASAKFWVNSTTGDASASGNLTVGNGGQIRSAYGPLNLAYKSGANAWTTGMVINEQGNVGIGTTIPSSNLEVSGVSTDSNNPTNISVSNTSADAGARVGFNFNINNTSVGTLRLSPTWLQFNTNNTDNFMGFVTSGTSDYIYFTTGSGEKLRIASSGNVGIGTNSPDYALQVNGVVAPETTDQDLGTTSLRWDLLANTIDADSTVTLTGLGTGTDDTVLILNSSNQVTTDEIDSRVWGSTLVDGSGTANYVARWTPDTNSLGTGVLYDNGTNVGVGTTNPTSLFSVGATSQFQVDSNGIIASIDGVAHSIDDVGGNLTLNSNSSTISLNDSVTFASTTTLNGITYTWPGSQSANYVLQTNGSGTLSWVDANAAAASSNYWTQADGAIYPKNSTVDLLVGGTASTSAKFAVLNTLTGTPTASISGSSAGFGLSMTGDGTIATTLNRNLLINPTGGNVGIGTTDPTSTLGIGGQTIISTTATDALKIYGTSRQVSVYETDQSDKAWSFGVSSTNFEITENGVATPVVVEAGAAANLLRLIANDRVGIADSTPDAKLEILSTSEQLRLTYADNAQDARFSVDVSGNLTIDVTGGTYTAITDNLQVNGGSIGIAADTDLIGLAADTVTVNGTLNATTALQTNGTSRIDTSGNLTNIGTTQLNTITYTWPGSQSANYVLQTNGSGTLSWVDANATVAPTIYWTQANGAIYPKNPSVDMLVGGSATTSAKFAVLNMITGTPTASISANSGNIATYIKGDGTLATTNRQNLTIGNSTTYDTTGNVLINPNGTGNVGIGTTAPSSMLQVNRSGAGIVSKFYDGTDGTGQGLVIRVNEAANGTDVDNLATLSSTGAATGSLAFGTGDVERMRITNDGTVGIGTTNPSTLLQLGTAGTTAGTLSLAGGTSGLVTIDVAAAAGTWAFTLPTSGGTNGYLLQTDGSGNTSWLDPSTLGGSSSYWAVTDQQLYPINYANLDLMVGGTSTASAKFFAQANTGNGYFAGNVGIGTTTPDYALQVNGVIAPETTDQDLGTTSLRWDLLANTIDADSTVTLTGLGTGTDDTVLILNSSNQVTTDEIDSRVWGSTLVDGSGTANYIARWTPDTNSLGTGVLYDDGTNVGIGTTVPTAKLDVAGSASLSGTLAFRGTTDPKIDVLNGENLGFRTSLNGDAGLTERMTILNNGNVGIGTTNPVGKLEVSNSEAVNLFVTDTGGAKAWINAGTSNTLLGSYTNHRTGLTVNGTEYLSVITGGNVGIGTTNPSTLLQLGTAGTTAGTLSLAGGTSGLVTVDVAAAAGTWAMTLPTSGGTNGYIMQTDGSGNLSWVDPATLSTQSSIWGMTSEQIHPQNALWSDLAIGGTSTASAQFLVQANTGYVKAQRFQDTANTDYYLDPASVGTSLAVAGSVGIGTTNPTHKLTIAGASSTISNASGDITIDSASNNISLSGDNLINFAQLQGNNGSVSAPTFAFQNDTDTGLYMASTGNMRLVTAGADRVTIDSTGNVGIGTATPTALLHIDKNLSSGNLFKVGNNGTDKFTVGWDGHATISGSLTIGTSSLKLTDNGTYSTINSSGNIALNSTGTGNVGIGTTNPGAKLDVRGSAIFNEDSADADFRVESDGNINMLFVDASTNRVGIGTSTPTSTLTVVGDTLTTGNASISGTLAVGILSEAGAGTCNAASEGQMFYNKTDKIYEYCDGTAWSPIGAPVVDASGNPVANQVILTGWDYVTASTVNPQLTITYGITFDSAPVVTAVRAGTDIASPAPASLADCNSDSYYTEKGVQMASISTTNFTIRTASSTGTYDGADYICYTWIAIGTYAGVGADLSENYLTYDPSLTAGEIVAVDTNNDISVAKTNEKTDKAAIGVVSTYPEITMGSQDGTTGGVDTSITGQEIQSGNAKTVAVALSGRVPVKVNLENGPIKKGDAITSSSTPGVGMKATGSVKIIGYAMEDFNGTSNMTATMAMVPENVQYTQAQLEQIQVEYKQEQTQGIGRVMVMLSNEFINEDKYQGVLTLNEGGQLENMTANTANITNLETANITIAGNPIQIYVENIVSQVIASLDFSEQIAQAVNQIKNVSLDSIASKVINTQDLNIAGQNIRDYVASIVNQVISEKPEQLANPVTDNELEIALTNPDGNGLEQLIVTNKDKEAVFSIDDQGNVSALGQLMAGEIKTATIEAQTSYLGEIIANNIQTATIAAHTASISGKLVADSANIGSARIAQLEAKMADLEKIKATTAELVNATISGTLYADDIYGFEDKIAQAIENSSLLNNLWPEETEASSSASVQSVYEAVNLAGFNATSSSQLAENIEDFDLTSEDIVLTSAASYVNQYFQVNGNAYIAGKLGVDEGIVIGDGMQLAYGIVNVLPNANNPRPTLHLQPSGGAMSLLAGLMTLDDLGQVDINGDLNVAGKLAVNDSLLTNLLKPVDYSRPIQIQLAQAATVSGRPITNESRFEFINQAGMPVATVSAHGKASFSGGIDVGSQDLTATTSSEVVTDQPSGKASIKAFTKDVIISSPLITNKSLIYVTPIGSTGNQVMYVKTQVAENPDTITAEGRFTVGFDYSLTQDASFNWWIVN